MKRICVFLTLLMAMAFLFPAYADEQGSFQFEPFQGGAMGIQMIDVTVDEGAGVMSLHPLSDVTSVVVEQLRMDAYMTATEIYHADSLTSNQVLNIKAYLSDVFPALRVTCVNSEGEIERWYLADSGEDGSLLLLSAQSVEPFMPNIFSELAGVTFTFSSGAGAWSTHLTFAKDGSFTGEYHDSEMGEMSDAYPNGSEYGCLFNGKLSYAGQLDEYTFSLSVESLQNDEGQLPEMIEGGVRYVTTAPYGLEHADTLTLYAPGCPIESLPEELMPWLHLEDMQGDHTTLTAYVLYNAAEGYGFVGEPSDDGDK